MTSHSTTTSKLLADPTYFIPHMTITLFCFVILNVHLQKPAVALDSGGVAAQLAGWSFVSVLISYGLEGPQRSILAGVWGFCAIGFFCTNKHFNSAVLDWMSGWIMKFYST